MSDNVNLIAIEGHGWPEEPYLAGSAVIALNPQSQWLGTQQVTPLESYNLLLPEAGGVAGWPPTTTSTTTRTDLPSPGWAP